MRKHAFRALIAERLARGPDATLLIEREYRRVILLQQDMPPYPLYYTGAAEPGEANNRVRAKYIIFMRWFEECMADFNRPPYVENARTLTDRERIWAPIQPTERIIYPGEVEYAILTGVTPYCSYQMAPLRWSLFSDACWTALVLGPTGAQAGCVAQIDRNANGWFSGLVFFGTVRNTTSAGSWPTADRSMEETSKVYFGMLRWYLSPMLSPTAELKPPGLRDLDIGS